MRSANSARRTEFLRGFDGESEHKIRELKQKLGPLSNDKLRVLFVTCRFDAPYRYRCVHACEQLRDCGVVANVLRLNDPILLTTLPSYSLIILFRLEWSDRVSEVIRNAHDNGLKVGFDIDDLVFHPSVEPMVPFLRRLPNSTVDQYRAQFVGLLTTLRAADFCIAATPAIAKYQALEQKPVIVHPNLLSRAYLKMSPLVYRLRPVLLRREMVGYMSGSHTHDGDLDHVAPALEEIFERHPKMRLVVCGPVSLPASLRSFQSRITSIGYQDYRVYPWLMARCQAVIAPLEVVNDFTNAKSALKVFEAAVFGVPVVASPAESYREAIDHGATGFLAHSTKEWVAALSALMDRDTSLRLGRAARRRVLHSYSPRAYPSLLAGNLLLYSGEAKGNKPALLKLDADEASLPAHVTKVAPLRLERAAQSIRLAIARPESLADEADSLSSTEEQVQEADGAASRWIVSAQRSGSSLVMDGSTVGWIIADRLKPFVHWNGDLVPIQGRPDAAASFRVVGSDPMFTADRCPALKTARFVLVEMTARSAFSGVMGQMFFSRGGGQFTEQLSLRFEVVADGRPRTYLLRLSSALQRLFRSAATLRVRFDPLDWPGEIELKTIAVLSKLPRETAESSLEQVAVLQKSDRPISAPPPVDIVIPIHNSRALTRRCVESVLEHATGDWRLILVDDASDEAGIAEDLARLAASNPRIRLLVNDRNEGFVRSANRGMREAQNRDVLLVNSDTEVFAGFLERLAACAHADNRTGVVSPFSNNATICSVPEFGRDNPIPAGYTAASYAELITACSRQRRPEIVTAVGFCMYIKASVFARLGYFDESYGRGFGEENDFCERAKKAGFTVRLCDDVFVWHKGKASFGEEGKGLESKNALLLEAKQPGYHAAVAAFLQSNPLAPLHSEIQFHTKRFRGGSRQAILYIVHASPFAPSAGETELHLRDLLRALGFSRAVVAYPAGQQLIFAEIINGDLEQPLIYRVPLFRPAEGFCLENAEVIGHVLHALELFGIGGVHIHHLLHWPINLGNALYKRQIKTVYSSHDFYCVCPSWNLYNHAVNSACECDRSQSSSGCLPALVAKTGIKAGIDLAFFRERHRQVFSEFLSRAHACIFPSAAARDVVRRNLSIPLERTRVIANNAAAVRELYDLLGITPAASSMPASEVLAELYLRSDRYREFAATEAQRKLARGQTAAPKYQRSAWYPAFVKLKPLIPQAVRQLGRRALVRMEGRDKS